jgi:tetratricopeptide (TPR) repeat protein
LHGNNSSLCDDARFCFAYESRQEMVMSLDEAIRAREEERYDDAHAILSALLAEDPHNALANYQMAWLHDTQGLERAAVPWYEAAISGELPEAELRGAYLGLGSTLRTLGEYARSVDVLRKGMACFPEAGEYPAFLAMALYNCGEHAEAMALLLSELARSSGDAGVERYRRAILFYHDKLDETWPGEDSGDGSGEEAES